MVVGITGGYCSGKDTAASLFARNGFRLIDVDRLGHRALEMKSREIVARFGEGVLVGNRIDRKALGRIVFADRDARADLEKIVHPWMIRRVRDGVRASGKCVINAALLVEMCLHVLCDVVIAIRVERETAVERALRRDGVSREEAESRLDAQFPVKEKLHLVDIHIENDGTLESFEHRMQEVLDALSSKDR
jgi:dephospho-CoA kinase